jgi:hypothetical protein
MERTAEKALNEQVWRNPLMRGGWANRSGLKQRANLVKHCGKFFTQLLLGDDTKHSPLRQLVVQPGRIERGDDDHQHGGELFGELRRHLQSIHPRHLQVKQNQVRPKHFSKQQGFLRVGGSGDNLHSRLILEARANGAQRQPGIVHNQGTNSFVLKRNGVLCTHVDPLNLTPDVMRAREPTWLKNSRPRTVDRPACWSQP